MSRKKTMIELHRMGVEEYKEVEKLPVTVVLDNVRSEMNVGSVMRTADAFLIERIVLCGITPQPPKRHHAATAQTRNSQDCPGSRGIGRLAILSHYHCCSRGSET